MGSGSKTVLLASAGTAASGSATSATVGPIRSVKRCEGLEVEAVDRRRIPADHGRHLGGRDAAEGVAQRFPGVGSGPLEVRVVASPHDSVDADSVALGALDGTHEAGTDVTLAGPVLAGLEGQRAGGGPGEAGDRRVRSPVTGRRDVERVEGRRYPPGALLGEDHGEVRMAIQCAAEDQVPQRPVRPPVRLVHPHRERAAPPVRRARSGVAAVVVDHQARLGARRPERLPVLGVERGNAGAGRDPGQQHTAAQAQAWRSAPPRRWLRRGLRAGSGPPRRAAQATRSRSRPASDCAHAGRPSAARARGRSPVEGRPGSPEERTAARYWGR